MTRRCQSMAPSTNSKPQALVSATTRHQKGKSYIAHDKSGLLLPNSKLYGPVAHWCRRVSPCPQNVRTGLCKPAPCPTGHLLLLRTQPKLAESFDGCFLLANEIFSKCPNTGMAGQLTAFKPKADERYEQHNRDRL